MVLGIFSVNTFDLRMRMTPLEQEFSCRHFPFFQNNSRFQKLWFFPNLFAFSMRILKEQWETSLCVESLGEFSFVTRFDFSSLLASPRGFFTTVRNFFYCSERHLSKLDFDYRPIAVVLLVFWQVEKTSNGLVFVDNK